MVDIDKIMQNVKESQSTQPKSNDEVKLSDFEMMVAKWLTFDYYCPSIKAEVIWDMLLSEFIPDILACATSKPASSFYLLAKEFPIKKKTEEGEETETDEDEKSLRSPKADYLVAYENNGEKKLIIVELKTTLYSESQAQLNNYLGRNAGEMFKHYKKIIEKVVKSSLYGKEPLQWKGSEKYTGQITYMYDQIQNYKSEKGGKADNKQSNKAFIEKLEDRYDSGEEVDVYYLYVLREKMRQDGSCKFSVRIKKRKKLDEIQDEKPVIIYSPKDKTDLVEEKTDLLNEMWDKNLKQLQENTKQQDMIKKKMSAWQHLALMIDAVYNYSEDFNEKKKYLE